MWSTLAPKPEEILYESTVVAMAGSRSASIGLARRTPPGMGFTASHSFGASDEFSWSSGCGRKLHDIYPRPFRQAAGVTAGSRAPASREGEVPDAPRRSFAFSGKRRLSSSYR